MERFQEATPDARGRMVGVLFGNAIVSTVVVGGLATSVALSAARIWRRRDQGVASAVRSGGHWRTVAGFAVATAAVRLARKPLTEWLTSADVDPSSG
jgi:hypothetical protein